MFYRKLLCFTAKSYSCNQLDSCCEGGELLSIIHKFDYVLLHRKIIRSEIILPKNRENRRSSWSAEKKNSSRKTTSAIGIPFFYVTASHLTYQNRLRFFVCFVCGFEWAK